MKRARCIAIVAAVVLTAGRGHYNNLYDAGSFGYFWSSTFYDDYDSWCIYSRSTVAYTTHYDRDNGITVRPVTQ